MGELWPRGQPSSRVDLGGYGRPTPRRLLRRWYQRFCSVFLVAAGGAGIAAGQVVPGLVIVILGVLSIVLAGLRTLRRRWHPGRALRS